MFFNKHKKQGREMGQNLLTMLSAALIGTPFFDENGKWKPPVEFFEDDYVFGFITGFSGMVIDVGLGGRSWSQDRRGECIIEVFKILDETGTLQRRLINLSSGSINRSPVLQNGSEAGMLAAVVIHNKLRPDYSSTDLVEAINMAKRLFSMKQFNSLNEALPLSVLMVTIAKYLKENWRN